MLAWCLHWGEDRSCSLTPPPPCPAFGNTFSPFLAFSPREAAPGLGFIATSALCSPPATSPLSPAAAPRVPPSAPRRHPPAGRGRGRGRAGRPEPASKALMEAEGGGRAAAGKRGGRECSPAASPPSPRRPLVPSLPSCPPRAGCSPAGRLLLLLPWGAAGRPPPPRNGGVSSAPASRRCWSGQRAAPASSPTPQCPPRPRARPGELLVAAFPTRSFPQGGWGEEVPPGWSRLTPSSKRVYQSKSLKFFSLSQAHKELLQFFFF